MNRLTQSLLGFATILFSLTTFPLTPHAAPAQVHDASRHLYDRVMEEFKHRDYEAALAGFRLFIELHGQTSLAANAQYWVGECQYRLGRYKDALKAFYNVVSYYPLSPKLAASTLKIGQTYTKLKDHEKARMMYERVVDQYPDSPEAELARKAIEVEAAKSEPAPQITEDATPSMHEGNSSAADVDASALTRTH
jgi:tol-pal system protein YbgF